jgi:hypothetical protein
VLGIFNRQCIDREVTLAPDELGFGEELPGEIFSIWEKKLLFHSNDKLVLNMKADGVIFVRY